MLQGCIEDQLLLLWYVYFITSGNGSEESRSFSCCTYYLENNQWRSFIGNELYPLTQGSKSHCPKNNTNIPLYSKDLWQNSISQENVSEQYIQHESRKWKEHSKGQRGRLAFTSVVVIWSQKYVPHCIGNNYLQKCAFSTDAYIYTSAAFRILFRKGGGGGGGIAGQIK